MRPSLSALPRARYGLTFLLPQNTHASQTSGFFPTFAAHAVSSQTMNQYFPNSDEMASLRRFVADNAAELPERLRLKYHGDGRPWIPMAISHLESLRKSGRKFIEWSPAFMPVPLSVEQASSEKVAALHGRIAAAIAPGCRRFVDLTCGLGIDCRAIVEALDAGIEGPESRVEAFAIEMSPLLALTAAFNFGEAGVENIEVVEAECRSWLEDYIGVPFGLAFIDPARRGADGARVYNIHDCSPDVATMGELFARKAPLVMAKLSPMLDITQTLRDLRATVSLHVVDDGSECRELLAVLDYRGLECAAGLDAEIVVDSADRPPFRFTLAENASASVELGDPVAGMWLFEPSPAAMKAAPFALLCSRFGLRKIHPNTNLFVADSVVEGLPGKWMEIVEVLPFASNVIKGFALRYGHADVAVRNFPLTAAQLGARLKIKPGGLLRVVGVTLRGSGRTASQQSQSLLILRK